MKKNYWYVCIKPTSNDIRILNNAIINELGCYNYMINTYQNLTTTNKTLLMELNPLKLSQYYKDPTNTKNKSFTDILPGNIDKQTKLNMHIEFLLFLQTNIKQVHRKMYQTTLDNKRHIQLDRSQLKLIKTENGNHYITTPYTPNILVDPKSPIFNNPWSIAIIHQQPSRYVNHTSPWFVEFRNIKCKYDLDYMDNSPSSSGYTSDQLSKYIK